MNINRVISYFGFYLMLGLTKVAAIPMSEMFNLFSISFTLCLLQIIYSKYKEVGMKKFVISMVSFSSMVYVLGKWTFEQPEADALTIAGDYWYMLVISLVAFLCSRNKKEQ